MPTNSSKLKGAWWIIVLLAIYLVSVVGSCVRTHAQTFMGAGASGGFAASSEQTQRDTAPAKQEETYSGLTLRELVAKYNCEWVKEERKIYTDDELRQKAKELHLPDVVVRMAERCPR